LLIVIKAFSRDELAKTLIKLGDRMLAQSGSLVGKDEGR
tara:strand:- start:5424 stop:5540 length:117 start_codon:yes stop_codon:yes gene_type:complete